MSGLSSGQFADYLTIAIIASIVGVLLDLFLKHRSVGPPLRFAVIVILIVAAAGVSYWRIRAQPPKVESGPVGGLLPTGTVSPTGSPLNPASPTPQPKRAKETYVDSFVRENIAQPNKSLRRNGQWAVVISEPGSKESYPRLANAVSSQIAEMGRSTVAIFRSSATKGTGFEMLFAADPALSRRLEEYCDQILLGKITSGVQENPISPGLLKLTLTIDVKTISTKTGDVQHQLQTSAVGAGYEIGEARTNAEESLAANLRSELRNVIR